MKRLVPLCVLMIMMFTFGVPVQSQEAVISPTLVIQLEEIEAYVQETRGIELLEPLNRVFPSREQVEAFLLESLNEQLTPEIVEESVAFYVAFDFMEPGIDIVDLYLELLKDQIGGYYDPEDQSMNTILISGGELGDALPSIEQIIYAHEFVHALQDQHYGLESLGFSTEAIEELPVDQLIAVQALVEGDATVVMNLYVEALIERNPLAAIGLLTGSLASGSLTLPEGTPPILTRELFFPYNDGAEFVTALVREGGWDLVDEAFLDVPISSEQILHPEKYINRDNPINVTISDTGAVLDDSWELVIEETMGEFYLRSYLDNQLEVTPMIAAASGWGGDRYQIYEHSQTGEMAWILRIAWDTRADLDEFTDAYQMYGELRFGVPILNGCWSGMGEAICYSVNAGGESIITFAPSLDLANALVDSQQ